MRVSEKRHSHFDFLVVLRWVDCVREEGGGCTASSLLEEGEGEGEGEGEDDGPRVGDSFSERQAYSASGPLGRRTEKCSRLGGWKSMTRAERRDLMFWKGRV